uniref:Uncharacterized protein n=1 Tax=Arundo donax TaxID=35708 RepID=A0A0A9BVD6_ARUDO
MTVFCNKVDNNRVKDLMVMCFTNSDECNSAILKLVCMFHYNFNQFA